MEDEKSDKSKIFTWKLFGLMSLVFIVWLISWILSIWFFSEWDDRAYFGDMFGSINALFSGLAFAGIIFTIYLQKEELELQRKELRQTRDEFITQNSTLKSQRFENTFFQMVSLYNEIVDKLQIRDGSGRIEKSYNGRDCFEVVVDNFYNNLRKDFVAFGMLVNQPNDDDEEFHNKKIKCIHNSFFKTLSQYEPILAHYFRNLYQIIKFVHQSSLVQNKSNKQFYINIIRAQLSPNELIAIYFNLLMDNYGFPRFTYLASKYDLLQNINYQIMVNKFRESHLSKEDYLNIFLKHVVDDSDERVHDLLNS